MAILFSKVTLTADNGNTAQLLCGGIPTSNYDLEDWLIYQKFICDNISSRKQWFRDWSRKQHHSVPIKNSMFV